MTAPCSVLVDRGPLRLASVLVPGPIPLVIATMASMTPMPTVPEEVRGYKHHKNHDPETVLP
jgi:hypothetical protein